jgi:hypothetical protein
MYLSPLSMSSSHNGEHESAKDSSIIVAVDRDKNSQQAAKWAVDRLLTRGSTLQLVHVRVQQNNQNGRHLYNLFMLTRGENLSKYIIKIRCHLYTSQHL